MKLVIDTDNNTILTSDNGNESSSELYSTDGFNTLSDLWLKVGWNEKYPYCFSWMGRPIIQNPEDMVRTQEVIYRLRPDVIIETGVAHGGSLIYYASLMKASGIDGKIIGVDIEIRPHNRKAIEAHEMFPYITLIEGGSTNKSTIDQVEGLLEDTDKTVLVILDSCHSKAHVTAELEAYHSFVSPGSYIVATDGSMRDLHDVPRGTKDWVWDHPVAAAEEFVETNSAFSIEQPEWPFNESKLHKNITHWPSAWIRKTT